jgi:DNA-binding MarR family transcriptional regulator
MRVDKETNKFKQPRQTYIKNQLLVLEEIKRHIGKPCPTNGEIAEALRMPLSTAATAISRLYANGTITGKSGKNKHVFVITETGEATLPGALRKSILREGKKQWTFVTERPTAPHPKYEDVRIVTRMKKRDHAPLQDLAPAMRKVGC